MPEMSGEAEELYRWAARINQALKSAIPMLERGAKSCDLVRGLARKGKIEAAVALKNKVESQIWAALGGCIDPSKSIEERIELAQRTFGSKSVHIPPGVSVPAVIEDRNARNQELRFAREKVEALAHELAKSNRLLVNSADVLAAMAEKGWTNEKVATVWSAYLDEVFVPGQKLKFKQEAIGRLMEFVRSLEPKAVIEVDDDLGTMDEAQLRGLQARLLKGLIGSGA